MTLLEVISCRSIFSFIKAFHWFYFFNWPVEFKLEFHIIYCIWFQKQRNVLVKSWWCFKDSNVPVTELWERLAFGLCSFGTVRSQPAAFFGTGSPLTWAVGNLHSALSVLVSFFAPPKEFLLETSLGSQLTAPSCFQCCGTAFPWWEGAPEHLAVVAQVSLGGTFTCPGSAGFNSFLYAIQAVHKCGIP